LNQPLDADHYARLKTSCSRTSPGQELFGGPVRRRRRGASLGHPVRHAERVARLVVYTCSCARPHGPRRLLARRTVLHAPELHADPATHGTKSGTFVVIHFGQRTILIGGTRYAAR